MPQKHRCQDSLVGSIPPFGGFIRCRRQPYSLGALGSPDRGPKENGRVFAGLFTVVSTDPDVGPVRTKSFKDIEKLAVEDLLKTNKGLWVVAGVETDGSDNEGSSFGPGELVLEEVRGCVADVVCVQPDRQQLGSGGVVLAFVLHSSAVASVCFDVLVC